MLSNKQRACLLLLAVSSVAGWWAWRVTSLRPLYSNSHHHSVVGIHEHPHTHDQESQHGHHHVGLIGVTTHSHLHQHDHHHENPSELATQKKLTLLGHRHTEDDVVQFWGKATAAAGQRIELKFFRRQKNEFVQIRPSNESMVARIFNGSQFETDVQIEPAPQGLSGKFPTDFFCLPTHTIRIENLQLENQQLSASIPITEESG